MLKINPVLKSKCLYKPKVTSEPIDFMKIKFIPAADSFSRKVANNIKMVSVDKFLHYTFYENGNEIGYAIFDDSCVSATCKGLVPDDWFVENEVAVDGEMFPLQPYLYINELVINDRVGLEGEYSQRKSGKKYGTMCFQKILEWAEKHGFGTRLSLTPGKTYSDIEPNKFYTKIGFEMAPASVKLIEEQEERYGREPSFSLRKRYEKIDGRWVAKTQTLFLTHPEILKNYKL